jgi:hypothetical protein
VNNDPPDPESDKTVSVSRNALAAVSFAVFAGVATGVLETSHWNAAV